MTDRQQGAFAALNLEFSGSHNKFCARHVMANLKVKFPKLSQGISIRGLLEQQLGMHSQQQ